MCECGCVMNDQKYIFPAPGTSLYILTMSGACENCDAPPGVTIERIDPDNTLYGDYKRGEFTNGQLPFTDWPDSKGAAIITGMRKYEFVTSMIDNLVGVDSREMGDDGLVDKYGAEVILEEMYEDSQVQPHLVKAR